MELKKVWMSPDTKKKSKYGYRAVGGILGIVLLMVLLLCGGTLLSLSLGINKKAFSLLLLTAVSALGIGLAVLLGRRSIRDATIFFLTENDRLWVMACPIMGMDFLALPLVRWKHRRFCADRAASRLFPTVRTKF